MIYSELSVSPVEPYGAEVSFDVTNTSNVAGAEVGQVYVHQYSPKVARPDIELAGFAKAHLQPGETKSLTVVLDVSPGSRLSGTSWAYS